MGKIIVEVPECCGDCDFSGCSTDDKRRCCIYHSVVIVNPSVRLPPCIAAEKEYNELIRHFALLIELYDHVNKGAFESGVTSDGGLDEGEHQAWQIIDEAREFLKGLKDDQSDQDWFWTKEWQAGEKQVDKEIAEGLGTFYANEEEFLASLDEDDQPDKEG